ncbi:MAG TPA: hypothetical protein VJJ78_01325, partial [Candidatus Saccharimonadales bacterium]|nr:hypothetical protein [Candidatus Saccharimonadales bacterium]
YVGHKDDLDLGSIIANFNDSAERIDTTAIVSLIKRGAGSMAALLVMSGITAPNHSRAFDVSRRAQRRDSPFPELSSFKETLVEVARTVAEDGLYGGDRMGREMEISAKNRQPLVINTLREDERVDGELLEILFYCRMPRGKIQYILDRTEDVARLLFGIEKYQPDPDFINY